MTKTSGPQWPDFVRQVESELETGKRGHLSLDEPFDRESDLTRAIVHGLRRLFAEFYGNGSTNAAIHHHVIARQGQESEDHLAWKAAVRDKWILLHGVRFVPDVLIRPTLSPVTEVLPIEVKFIQKASSASQCVATAIGQGLAYTVRYPRSIVFVGVQRGLTKGRFALANLSGVAGDEAKLRTSLDEKGVHFILREVGT